MTDETTNLDAPPAVTVEPSTTMTFPTESADGKTYTAKEQFQQRLKSPTWVKDASTPGTPAHADLRRLQVAMAVQEANIYGAVDEPAAGAATSINATEVVVPWGNLPPDLSEEDRAGLQEVDATVREWGMALEAPAKDVNALVEAVNDAMLKLPNDPDGIEASREAGLAKVRAAWGADFQKNFDAACRVIDDLYAKHPNAANFVQANRHAILQPMVMGNLLQIARHRGFV